MSGITVFLFASLWIGILVWELISGRALGTWWRPIITRQDNPATYYFALAAHFAILIALMLTGNSWHVR